MKRQIPFSIFVAAAALCTAAAVPPVVLDNVRVQSIGAERNAVQLEEGLLFRDGDSDELYIATEAAPHGKPVGEEAAERAAQSARSEAASALAAHAADRTNPHEVTAVQAGAVPRTGGTMTGNLVLSSPSGNNSPSICWADGPTLAAEGNWGALVSSHILHFGVYSGGAWKYPFRVQKTGLLECNGIKIPTNTTSGTFMGFSIGNRTWYTLPNMSDYATTNDLASATNAMAESVAQTYATGAELVAATNALAGDIASEYATTGSVASVERRVGALEMPETCMLFWPSSYVQSNVYSTANNITVPTNFPTRRLYLAVQDDDFSNLSINVPKWNPDRDVVIDVQAIRSTNGLSSRTVYVRYNMLQAGAWSATNQYRVVRLEYDASLRCWNSEERSLVTRALFWDDFGNRDFFPPASTPTTVEEWIERYAKEE